MSIKIRKPLSVRPFPFLEYGHEEPTVFTKYRSVGFALKRTQSASPKMSQLLVNHGRSMPNLNEFSFDIEDINDESGVVQVTTSSMFATALSPQLSPDAVNDLITPRAQSFECPARLNSPQRCFPSNNRQRSNTIALGDESNSFCCLDTSREEIIDSDLPALVLRADGGLRAGVEPMLAEDSTGGSYFLRDKQRSIQLVFKPSDEEANAPNNPHQKLIGYGSAYKGRIVPGFGMYRELAAFAIDTDNFAGVPPTDIAKVRSPVFYANENTKVGPYGYKLGSIQSYVRSEGSAEEMGCGLFDVEDVMRIATLDIRICNLDRHAGNILVSRTAPYQSSRSQDDSTNENIPTKSSSAPTFSSLSPVMSETITQGVVSTYRLIPIDHGFCLPHILQLSDLTFTWLTWPHVRQPLPDDIKAYISRLDGEADCTRIRRLVGAAIPETSLLSLKIATMLLKVGVANGLTLYEIGMFMVAGHGDSSLSKLQQMVNKSIQTVAANDLASRCQKWPSLSPRRNSPTTVQRELSPAQREIIVNDETLRHVLALDDGIALWKTLESAIEAAVASMVFNGGKYVVI